jgi:hypothetical protein
MWGNTMNDCIETGEKTLAHGFNPSYNAYHSFHWPSILAVLNGVVSHPSKTITQLEESPFISL